MITSRLLRFALGLLIVSMGSLVSLSARPPRSERTGPHYVFDAHEDPVGRVLDRGDDLGDPTTGGQVDIPKWRAGGLNIVWLAIWVDPRYYRGYAAYERANALIDAVEEQVRRHRGDLRLCRTAHECREAARRGQIALLLGLEGGEPLLNSPELVAHFWRRGVTRITLTWRGDLPWAGSSQAWDQSAVRRPKGLNELGADIVRQMNRWGVVVDLSHCSDLTAYDALRLSTKPVIFSHSNCRALADHPRNVPDDLLRLLAANGGVIGVNFHSSYLLGRSFGGRWRPNRRASLEDVVRQIDYLRTTIGADHIGIGSDWDGDIHPAMGLEDASRLPQLFDALRQRGYNETELGNIAGGNFLRVLEANETGKLRR